MTTTIVQFTNGAYGPSASLSAFIGATASPGDWLQVLTSGQAGDGATDGLVVSDDVSGATGWVLDDDYDNSTADPTNAFRCQSWIKQCVGGETEVTATWVGPANKSLVGFLATDLTLPHLYKIASGLASVSGSFMHFSTSPGDILADHSSYIGMAAGGVHGLTDAEFVVPPSPTTQGGDGTNQDGACWTVAHYNEDESTNDTGQTLEYQVGPVQTTFALWYGFEDTPPTEVDLAGDAGLLIGGDTPLEVTAGMVALAGDAPLVFSGEAPLSQTGGEAHLAGVGRLLIGGSTPLSAPRPPSPPGPADLSDTLGCGIYEAMIFTRGLGEIVGMLPFGELDWGRELDGVSVGNLTIDGVANRSQLQKCCALLGEVEPFEHELALYRNGYRCWSGPITAMTFPPNQVQISAFDLAGWLTLRTLHTNYNAVQQDLITIWINYVQDAMAVDNSPGLHPTALALSGILADRLTQIVEHNLASDAIGELERTGLDWTTIDRVMQAGPVLAQPPQITGATQFPTLIDESFRTPPTIVLDGTQGANCWYVQSGAADSATGVQIFGEYGPAFDSTPDHVAQPAAPDYQAIEDQYGRIEKVTTESRVLDQPSIDANAQSRYDLTKRPVAVISEGLLLPSAPIAMRKLVPGSMVQVHLSNACKPIGDFYRIKSVKVTANADGSEDVDVEFQPLGTGTVLNQDGT